MNGIHIACRLLFRLIRMKLNSLAAGTPGDDKMAAQVSSPIFKSLDLKEKENQLLAAAPKILRATVVEKLFETAAFLFKRIRSKMHHSKANLVQKTRKHQRMEICVTFIMLALRFISSEEAIRWLLRYDPKIGKKE